MQIPRRSFLKGLGALLGAAAVRPSVLLHPIETYREQEFQYATAFAEELAAVTRRAFSPSLYTSIYETSPLLRSLTRR